MVADESTTRKCRRSRAWRRARWREHIEAQPLSGLCVVDYCRQHRLRRETFYRWRRVFIRESAAGVPLASGEAQAKTPAAPVFAEVRVPSDAFRMEAGGIELVLPGERRLMLGPGFDEDTLRRAIAVLESLPC